MKKFILFLIVTISLLPFTIPVCSFAENVEDEFSGQVNEILYDYDIGYDMGDISDFSFGNILTIIRNALISELSAPLKMLGTLITVIIFTSVVKSTAVMENNSLYNMICVMSAVTVTAPQLLTAYESAESAIEKGGGFMLVFVPVFSAITALCGGISTAGVYNVMILVASEIIVKLSESFLMPLLSVIAVLSVTGSVFPDNSVDGIVQLIKKLITWGITAVMTLFIGFVTLKCTITGKSDGLVAKTAKFVISGFVPIIGGAVSDAYSTVRGSFDIIRSTVGTVGVFAVFLILLIPVLKLMIFRLVMWIGSAVAEIFSEGSMTKLLKGFDSGLAIAQSILVCHALMFIICSAILMQTV